MKLLPFLAAACFAEKECFECKATVRITQNTPDTEPLPYITKVNQDCFEPTENAEPKIKQNCEDCFAIAYSLEYKNQDGSVNIYEYTMHRGCQEDYPKLGLSQNKEPQYAGSSGSYKPLEPWTNKDLTFENHETYGTIKAKYMTHPADTEKARYDSEATGISWNNDYGLKES